MRCPRATYVCQMSGLPPTMIIQSAETLDIYLWFTSDDKQLILENILNRTIGKKFYFSMCYAIFNNVVVLIFVWTITWHDHVKKQLRWIVLSLPVNNSNNYIIIIQFQFRWGLIFQWKFYQSIQITAFNSIALDYNTRENLSTDLYRLDLM